MASSFPVPKRLRSAFPNQPGDSGSTVGRAGGVVVTVEIEGLYDMLRRYSKASDLFDKNIRNVSTSLAEDLLKGAKVEAGSVSRSRQALEVMRGMKVRRDRVPSIKLSSTMPFKSKSRSNRKRGRVQGPVIPGQFGLTRKVTMGDVFFGAEFGGGARKTTRQFLRHRGQSGYFFWPTVRKKKNLIAQRYLAAIDRIVKKLEIG
jgi:hypothetical protein